MGVLGIYIDINGNLILYISIHFINILIEFMTDWNSIANLFIQKDLF